MERKYLDYCYNGIYYLNVCEFAHVDYKFLVDAVENGHVTTIRLLGAEEYHFTPFYFNSETYRVFRGFCRSHKVKLEIITGCNLSDQYGYRYNMLTHRDDFISWETFFAHQTVKVSLLHNILPLGHNPIINKHFTSLNNRAHNHRCLFLDHMFKENLFEHGYISFRNFDNINYNYKFKYWTPQILKFDNLFEEDINQEHLHPPLEFKDSLFSLVCESSVDVQFITEKTYMPIWHRRPFLVYGHPHANKYLTSIGFRLFDNVIDYSFDSIEDDRERCIEFMKQVRQLCNQNINNLKEKVNAVVHFNWLNLIDILGRKKTIKPLLKKLDPNTTHKQVNAYRSMLNITKDESYIALIDSLTEQYQNEIANRTFI